MNSQANLSLLRQMMTVVGGLLAGYGVGTADQMSHLVNDVMVMIPAAVSAGSILWSVYAHYKQVKVPEQTIVKPEAGAPSMPAVVAVKEGVLTSK